MPKYVVESVLTRTYRMEVEADNEWDAIEIMRDSDYDVDADSDYEVDARWDYEVVGQNDN
jgi:hypothetical protein